MKYILITVALLAVGAFVVSANTTTSTTATAHRVVELPKNEREGIVNTIVLTREYCQKLAKEYYSYRSVDTASQIVPPVIGFLTAVGAVFTGIFLGDENVRLVAGISTGVLAAGNAVLIPLLSSFTKGKEPIMSRVEECRVLFPTEVFVK